MRFVSSPDVLERFVTIEKEIEQIQESIRSNELACEEVDANGTGLLNDLYLISSLEFRFVILLMNSNCIECHC